jgi:hypothetical protein
MAVFTILNGSNKQVGSVEVVFTADERTTRMDVSRLNGEVVGTFVRYGWGFADKAGIEKGIVQLPLPEIKTPQTARAYIQYSELVGGIDGDRIYRTAHDPISLGTRVGFVGVGVWTDPDEELIKILGDRNFGNDPKDISHPNRLNWETRERRYRLKLYTLAAGCGALLCSLV